MPKSPICKSSDAGSPLRSKPEISVCGVRLDKAHTPGALVNAVTISLLPQPGGPTSSGQTTSPSA